MSYRNIYSAAGERMRNLNIPDKKKACLSEEQKSKIENSEENSEKEKEQPRKKAETHYDIYSAVGHRMRHIKVSDDEKKDPSPEKKTIVPQLDYKEDTHKEKVELKNSKETERVKTNIDLLVSTAHKMRYIDTTSHQIINFKKLFEKFKKNK